MRDEIYDRVLVLVGRTSRFGRGIKLSKKNAIINSVVFGFIINRS